MSQELIDAITEMREEDVVAITNQLLDEGVAPTDILMACKQAMDVIGKRFEEGDAFIPELILAGEMMTSVTDILKPRMAEESTSDKLGKIVIGTVQGDIHDIAKDIVAFMLDLNGFDVTDLGVDVPPEKFVETVQDTGATIVGLSGFLTLAFDPMKDTVAAFKAAGLDDVKIMIGGGQIDENIRQYTGANAYGRDAMAAVDLAKSWV
ncbi:MAG: cobalamin-dependent protein [Anaerolineae bacterium]|nr:cobalamin-dependent protein [Anaerolineae bacterium]MCB9133689.1 cobalamin B12-binding domain-containing protein [Anaerolineales bacterium]MCB0248487.1 cobalamin-dependent protein [Anaerolineae bacterium]MCB9141107.1 cobalamin B12-binding domain-containing protein [Anaerolineales bacterium]MCO5242527.1 cobalamin-dependent protein [Anaerolineae bacterium]